MSKKHIALASLFALISLTGVRAQELAMSDVPPPAATVVTEAESTPTYSVAVVRGAVLCWNEAGESPDDCRAIIHMRLASARLHHRTFEEELYYLHGDGRTVAHSRAALRSDRATNPDPRDQRPWLGDIAADLHQPQGWNETVYPWERMKPRLQRLFALVQGVLDGRVRSICRGTPVRWGGRAIDHDRIARALAHGEAVIDCGVTQNVFLGRPPRHR